MQNALRERSGVGNEFFGIPAIIHAREEKLITPDSSLPKKSAGMPL
jgi:hypothetical protein